MRSPLLSLLLVLSAAPVLLPLGSGIAAPSLDEQALFGSCQNGHHTYRIPALVSISQTHCQSSTQRAKHPATGRHWIFQNQGNSFDALTSDSNLPINPI